MTSSDDNVSRPGLFLTVEGIEGAGKTTQAELLARAIEAAGRRVVRTFEPGGGGPVAEELRRILKNPAHWRVMNLSEVYLYAAARAQHLEALVLPEVAAGSVVVCDRYLDSTRAYQGYGRGRPLQLIEALHRLPPLDRAPDRTLLLDVVPERGLDRARARAGTDQAGYDDEDLAFFTRVRDGFLALARAEPARVRVIDAARTVAEVHASVIAAVADLFPGVRPAHVDAGARGTAR
jgi:dTMP kinase